MLKKKVKQKQIGYSLLNTVKYELEEKQGYWLTAIHFPTIRIQPLFKIFIFILFKNFLRDSDFFIYFIEV